MTTQSKHEEAALPEYARAVLQRYQELQSQRQELSAQLEKVEEELRLLEKLTRAIDEWKGKRKSTRAPRRSRGGLSRRIADLVVERLQELGRPAHRSELRRYVESKGVVIPGETERSKWSTFSAALSRDPRVEPGPERGEWHLKQAPLISDNGPECRDEDQ